MVLLSSAAVVATCCGCVMVVEKLVKMHEPNDLCVLPFRGSRRSTYLFSVIYDSTAVKKLCFSLEFFYLRLKVFSAYVKVVVLFFLVNVINNQALNFRIPMPLHIIFRSGSLVSNLLLGRWLLNKQYSWRKYVSVFIISAGIILATVATYNSQQVLLHACGVSMLLFALIFSSVLGIFQEKMYRRYGKHSREAMFYVYELYTFLTNVFSHHFCRYFCIRFVYYLTAHCSTLTVTLVITIRKFISLLISIVVFRNPFTLHHWIGTVLVFMGTMLFVDTRSTTKPKDVHAKTA
ncbi:UAA domain containing protein [Trichuris trichiura]|uniref:UAA domain containing protein n=1 Tax=Trichuris trichiura TaxID=36087 RepID=A0A077ZE98_TRITR|nr:UAA domain containing protein [Trichuris trichiura]